MGTASERSRVSRGSARPWGADGTPGTPAEIPYDWIENRVREAAPPGRPSHRRAYEALLVAIGAVVLGYILYQAQVRGALRWALGSLVIAGLAAYAWFAVTRRTSEPPLLVPAMGRGRLYRGELSAFGAAVERANGGLPYSQVAVSSRARDAFAQRVALARGLTADDVLSLEQHPDRLRETVHDEVLEDFLFLRSSDHDERYRWVRDARDRGGFEAELRQVLERMEAWR